MQVDILEVFREMPALIVVEQEQVQPAAGVGSTETFELLGQSSARGVTHRVHDFRPQEPLEDLSTPAAIHLLDQITYWTVTCQLDETRIQVHVPRDDAAAVAGPDDVRPFWHR